MTLGNTPGSTSKVPRGAETIDKFTTSSFAFGSTINEKTDFGFGVAFGVAKGTSETTQSPFDKHKRQKAKSEQRQRTISADFEQSKVTSVETPKAGVDTEVIKATTEEKKSDFSTTSLVFGTPKATSSESPTFSFSLPAKRPFCLGTVTKTSSTTNDADTSTKILQFGSASASIVSKIPNHPPTEWSLIIAGSDKPHLQRHHEYYISDGNVIILAEHTLYRLHRSMLMKHSPVFKGMRPMHGMVDDPNLEGSSDAKPIVLHNVKAVDFDRFLWMLYPPTIGTNKARTLDEWTSILEQSHMWQTASIKMLAAKQLNKMTMEPVTKIELWQRCGMQGSRDLLSPFISVCQRVEALSLNEAQQLGMETFVKVVEVRDKLRQCTQCCKTLYDEERKTGSLSDDMEASVEEIVLKAFGLS